MKAKYNLIQRKIAIFEKNKVLTNKELNEQANQLIRFLRKKGVQAEALIGICLERSWLMIVSLLGILKAGALMFP